MGVPRREHPGEDSFTIAAAPTGSIKQLPWVPVSTGFPGTVANRHLADNGSELRPREVQAEPPLAGVGLAPPRLRAILAEPPLARVGFNLP